MFLAANKLAKGGIYNGSGGKYGGMAKLEAGAYVVKGEVVGDFNFFGAHFDYTLGGSALAAHAGIDGGIYYDDNDGKLYINQLAHFGCIFGGKGGFNASLPLNYLWK